MRRGRREQNSPDDEAGSDEPSEQKKPQSTDGSVLFDGIHVNHPQRLITPKPRHVAFAG